MNVARSPNTSPCISDKAHLLLTAAGPGTSGKGDRKEGVFLPNVLDRGCLTSKDLARQQSDCVGFKGLEMNKPSLYCLPGMEESSRESGHGVGKCGRVELSQ